MIPLVKGSVDYRAPQPREVGRLAQDRRHLLPTDGQGDGSGRDSPGLSQDQHSSHPTLWDPHCGGKLPAAQCREAWQE